MLTSAARKLENKKLHKHALKGYAILYNHVYDFPEVEMFISTWDKTIIVNLSANEDAKIIRFV